MTVVHAGVTHQVAVNPGPEGEREFLDTIRCGLGNCDLERAGAGAGMGAGSCAIWAVHYSLSVPALRAVQLLTSLASCSPTPPCARHTRTPTPPTPPTHPPGPAPFPSSPCRRIYGLGEHEEVCLTFGCKLPDSAQEEICLEGSACFDAAVHLASLSAGERLRKRQQQQLLEASQPLHMHPQPAAARQQQQHAALGLQQAVAAAASARCSQNSSPRSVADSILRFFRP